MFDHYIVRMGAEVKPLLILMMTMTLAFLMVSTMKYRSFKDLKFNDGHHFNYLVWANFGADVSDRVAASDVVRGLCRLCRFRYD